jgi:hypothetical protein
VERPLGVESGHRHPAANLTPAAIEVRPNANWGSDIDLATFILTNRNR